MAHKGHTHAAHSRAHSNERFGAGEVEGAGELEVPMNGPGRSKETKSTMPSEFYNSRRTPSAPKNVKTQNPADEED